MDTFQIMNSYKWTLEDNLGNGKGLEGCKENFFYFFVQLFGLQIMYINLFPIN